MSQYLPSFSHVSVFYPSFSHDILVFTTPLSKFYPSFSHDILVFTTPLSKFYPSFLMSQYLLSFSHVSVFYPSFSHVSVLSLLFSCLGTYPSFSHVPVFTPPFLMSRYFTLLLLAAPTQLMSKKEYIIYVRSFFISILRVSFYIFLFITCLH
uniref:Uncharacterized protein n=1 Tax=Cacopsylla melanoneura TaxID=428564 RepID=A0A8D9AW14_9HEMI